MTVCTFLAYERFIAYLPAQTCLLLNIEASSIVRHFWSSCVLPLRQYGGVRNARENQRPSTPRLADILRSILRGPLRCILLHDPVSSSHSLMYSASAQRDIIPRAENQGSTRSCASFGCPRGERVLDTVRRGLVIYGSLR